MQTRRSRATTDTHEQKSHFFNDRSPRHRIRHMGARHARFCLARPDYGLSCARRLGRDYHHRPPRTFDEITSPEASLKKPLKLGVERCRLLKIGDMSRILDHTCGGPGNS